MSQPARETDVVVLGYQNHGESDRIVTCYSKDTGKLTTIAKGANRSKKRFVNKLEPFTFLTVNYSLGRKGSLALLTDAELHNSFIHIRQNYTVYMAASVILEMMQTVIHEQEGDEQLFNLLIWALHRLDSQKEPLSTIPFFMIRFFDLLGYRPELSACAGCGSTDDTSYSFSLSAGGLQCEHCRSLRNGQNISLQTGTIKLLNSAMTLPLNRLGRLQLSGNMLNEALNMCHKYARQLFQRDFDSWKMVRKNYR